MWRRLPAMIAGLALVTLLVGSALLWFGPEDPRDTSVIFSVDYLRDPDGLGLEAVRKATFRPVTPVFSGGYDRAAHWFRIRIRPSGAGGPVFLGISPAFLDEATLFSVNQGGQWTAEVTGDHVPMDQRATWGANLGFRIDPRDEGSLYYLRVRTESTVQVFLTARPWSNEMAQQSRRMALHTLLFSAMALALVLAFIQAFYRATLADFLLVASSASYLVYSFFMLGYPMVARPEWPSADLARLADMLYFGTSALTLAFHRQFLAPMKPRRATIWLADVLMAGCIVAFVAYLAGFEVLAFQANSAAILLTSVVIFAMAWTASESDDPPLTVIHNLYTAFCATSSAWMTLNLGLAPAIGIYRYSVEIHGLLNVALVLSLVISRWWSMKAKFGAQRARIRNADLRREIAARSAEAKDKLLNMLVHELRNHLTVIRMSIAQTLTGRDLEQAEQRVLALESMVIDFVRYGRIERGDWPQRAAPVDLGSEVMEALADTGDDEWIDVEFDEALPCVVLDSAMLRIAITSIVTGLARAGTHPAPVVVRVGAGKAGAGKAAAADAGCAIVIRRAGIAAAAQIADLLGSRDFLAMGGEGIGRQSLSLAIAKGIAELMGGTLHIDHDGNMIECRLTLPAHSPSR